jgi:hypothetical protein
MAERISKSQAAAIARCCEKSIERAVSDGELMAVREHGRILIDEADLRQWIEARQARGRRRATPLAGAFEYERQSVRRVMDTDSEAEVRKFQKEGVLFSMRRNDNLELASRALKMAEHHESLGKLHREAHAHHMKMANDGTTEGPKAATPTFSKAFVDDAHEL